MASAGSIFGPHDAFSIFEPVEGCGVMVIKLKSGAPPIEATYLQELSCRLLQGKHWLTTYLFILMCNSYVNYLLACGWRAGTQVVICFFRCMWLCGPLAWFSTPQAWFCTTQAWFSTTHAWISTTQILVLYNLSLSPYSTSLSVNPPYARCKIYVSL